MAWRRGSWADDVVGLGFLGLWPSGASGTLTKSNEKQQFRRFAPIRAEALKPCREPLRLRDGREEGGLTTAGPWAGPWAAGFYTVCRNFSHGRVCRSRLSLVASWL